VLREGAQRMLQKAIENEVQEFVQAHADLRADDDRHAAVRNGSLPIRQIVTGLRLLEVQQPRVRDRRSGEKVRFSSNILRKYLRRVPSVDALIPALYLRGINIHLDDSVFCFSQVYESRLCIRMVA
jgi:putative transposase